MEIPSKAAKTQGLKGILYFKTVKDEIIYIYILSIYIIYISHIYKNIFYIENRIKNLIDTNEIPVFRRNTMKIPTF